MYENVRVRVINCYAELVEILIVIACMKLICRQSLSTNGLTVAFALNGVSFSIISHFYSMLYPLICPHIMAREAEY